MNELIEIVGIQFKGVGKIYYFSPLDYKFKSGDAVVVETVRGLEMGKVIIGNKAVPAEEIEYELKPVVRRATHKDIENEERNSALAPKSFEIFKKHVRSLNRDMKPLYCEYTVDAAPDKKLKTSKNLTGEEVVKVFNNLIPMNYIELNTDRKSVV